MSQYRKQIYFVANVPSLLILFKFIHIENNQFMFKNKIHLGKYYE